ncbi:MAG: thioredoxin family protein [bacterium]
MKIEVLGTGCAKCQAAEALCKEAVEELGMDAEVIKVSKIHEIAKRGVFATPAVVIEGKVKCVGRIPKLEEVKQWLQAGN